MKIIFMGTPEFAAHALEKLHENGHDILLVVTQPDRPSGRGKKLKKSAVKEKAEELSLTIFQPDKIRKEENIQKLKSYSPDVIIVVAYGQILSKTLLDIPKYGCINVHASILPHLRGAAPINWALINGDKKTGVTTMQMDAGIDTGDMLLISETDIDNNMNAGDLHDALMGMGAELLVKTLKHIENNDITPVKQDDNLSSYAPMLTKETLKINWHNKAENIHNLIRGLSPWPAAYFNMEDKSIKVYKSGFINGKTDFEPGYVIKSDDEGIFVAAEDGILIIKELQMPGKNKMSVSAYLRGNKFPEKIVLNGDER